MFLAEKVDEQGILLKYFQHSGQKSTLKLHKGENTEAKKTIHQKDFQPIVYITV